MTILGTLQRHEFPMHILYSRTLQINSALRNMWSNIFCNVIYLTITNIHHILVDLGTKYFYAYSTMGIYWEKNTGLKGRRVQCVCLGGVFPLDESIPFYFCFYLSGSISPNETNKKNKGAEVKMSYFRHLYSSWYRRKCTLTTLATNGS